MGLTRCSDYCRAASYLRPVPQHWHTLPARAYTWRRSSRLTTSCGERFRENSTVRRALIESVFFSVKRKLSARAPAVRWLRREAAVRRSQMSCERL